MTASRAPLPRFTDGDPQQHSSVPGRSFLDSASGGRHPHCDVSRMRTPPTKIDRNANRRQDSIHVEYSARPAATTLTLLSGRNEETTVHCILQSDDLAYRIALTEDRAWLVGRRLVLALPSDPL